MQPAKDEEVYIFTMGTVFEVRAIAPDPTALIQKASQELYRCNDLVSWRQEGSIPDLFNSNHKADVSEISDMIGVALQVGDDSHGAFDMTVLPLSVLWQFDRMGEEGFDISEMTVPDQEAIEAALANVDYRQLDFNEDQLVLSSENEQLSIVAVL